LFVHHIIIPHATSCQRCVGFSLSMKELAIIWAFICGCVCVFQLSFC
jgi:hypothetical protein